MAEAPRPAQAVLRPPTPRATGPRAILERHRAGLRGRLRLVRRPSPTLGIAKTFYVYEPPGVQAGLPLLWLFRGHEREWVNIREDPSRLRGTAIEDLDAAIAAGLLPPVVAVLPGLTSSDNHVHSLGVDMVGALPPTKRGLGTGRFWTYLADELVPWAERRYRPSQRIGVGFSAGGFVVSLLAFGRPGYLDHAASYDGLFPWPAHDDPRRPEHVPLSDRVWTTGAFFDAAFGRPRVPGALARWNTTDRLLSADAETLAALRGTTFWIQSAGADGSRGNRDRARHVAGLLAERGLRLGFDSTVLAPEAAHTWHWCDRFLGAVLTCTLRPTLAASLLGVHEEAPGGEPPGAEDAA